MRRFASLLACLLLAHAAAPVLAQAPARQPPHAWLFGTWSGGIFPAPSNITAEACLSQPVVIFTRDLVLRATVRTSAGARMMDIEPGTGKLFVVNADASLLPRTGGEPVTRYHPDSFRIETWTPR